RPRQILPGSLVRSRRGDRELDRVRVARGNGINGSFRFLRPTCWQRGTQRDLLWGIGLVADDDRHPERFSGGDLRFGRVQVSQVLDIVGAPEGPVEGPWTTKFERHSRSGRFVSASAGIGYRLGRDPLEDVAGRSSANKRLAENEPHRHLGKFFQLGIGEIILSLVIAPRLGCYA